MDEQNVLSVQQVEAELSRGKAFKSTLGLYEQVKKNERFYIGEQWDGLKSAYIRPLTMNFMRRTCCYFQSMILSDDIGYNIRPFADDAHGDEIASIYEHEIDRVFERTKLKQKNRDSLRDMIVDGDAVKYFFYDPDVPNGQEISGEIKAENLMNTNVIFGNPYSGEVQEQPYILIVRRRPVTSVRKEAKAAGVSDWESITSENEGDYVGEETGQSDTLCTEVTRFWKQNGRVWFAKFCGKVTLKQPTETAMTLYPISYMSWEERKNCYHGVSPMTEILNTQIAVNQMWTAVNVFIQSAAFPKIVYNVNKFPNGWDGNPGRAVAVSGDVREALTSVAGGVNLPNVIVQIMETIVSTTRDFMGANDAALGNVRPDNTSAIIAVQKASSAPLEVKRLHFYQFIEDCVRIIVDMMGAYYGTRRVKAKVRVTGEDGAEHEDEQMLEFDFSAHELGSMEVNVDIGQASYWSELIAVQTADNLFTKGIYGDMAQYLDALPDALIPNKSALMREVRAKIERNKQAQQLAQTQQTAQAPLPGMPEGMPQA